MNDDLNQPNILYKVMRRKKEQWICIGNIVEFDEGYKYISNINGAYNSRKFYKNPNDAVPACIKSRITEMKFDLISEQQ